jgi:hypothetical protein
MYKKSETYITTTHRGGEFFPAAIAYEVFYDKSGTVEFEHHKRYNRLVLRRSTDEE